jgi:hypothetical protein
LKMFRGRWSFFLISASQQLHDPFYNSHEFQLLFHVIELFIRQSHTWIQSVGSKAHTRVVWHVTSTKQSFKAVRVKWVWFYQRIKLNIVPKMWQQYLFTPSHIIFQHTHTESKWNFNWNWKTFRLMAKWSSPFLWGATSRRK